MTMTNYTITISRQFGSLGREIGKRLARELEIDYYDRDLIEKAAEAMGVNISDLYAYDELLKGKFTKMLYPLGIGSISTQRKLFEVQKSMILDLAAQKSCVIVGRCADYILKDYPNSVHFFIYAPYEKRLINCINTLRLYDTDAVKIIEGVDKARAAYHHFFTGTNFESLSNRHVLIDSSLLAIDDTVQILKEIVCKKFEIG